MELVNREEVFYPESDGAPMAETSVHVQQIIDSLGTLREWLDRRFADQPVALGANQFLYYREGDPRKSVSPDMYVAFGLDAVPLRVWKTWEEGFFPQVVFEFLSRSTAKHDLGFKRELYEGLGVEEYFVFDQLEEIEPPRLRGWRRVGRAFVGILPEPGLGVALRSEMLGLILRGAGQWLRFIDPGTGLELPLVADALRDAKADTRAAEERARAAEERERAAEERERAAEERERAAEERERAAEERGHAAELGRREAEAETIRLRGEVERLRKSSRRD